MVFILNQIRRKGSVLLSKRKIPFRQQDWAFNAPCCYTLTTGSITLHSNINNMYSLISHSTLRVLVHTFFWIWPQVLINITTYVFSGNASAKVLSGMSNQTCHCSFPTKMSSLLHVSKPNHSEVVPLCLFDN